jgi:endonuclease-3
MAKKLMNDYEGEVPTDFDSLITLPGVGRKTTNVMLSVAFDTPAMAVDTHVFRVANRIGLTTNAKNPLESERELVKHIPREVLSKAHHWLILHGRYVCVARSPKCDECGLKEWCKYYQKAIKK